MLFFIPLTVDGDQFIQGMEMPNYSSWVCFVAPKIMYYFKLWRLGRWSSICKIYFA